jgi:hypothetical protein
MSPDLTAHWTTLQALAIGGALAWASGLRLYVVLLVLGLGSRYGYIDLPRELSVLAHPYVITASGILVFVEFFADKIPGLDSIWDAVHTFIRIPAGALLAAGIAGEEGLAVALAAGLLGGTITAGTHFTKAGTRLAANTSPEPFSNWGLSFAEDAMVAGGLWLAWQHPFAFLALLALFILAMAWLLPRLWRFVRRMLAAAGRMLGTAPAAQDEALR